MARITVEIDGEFLEDIREAFGAETDEDAVRVAVVDAAKRQRRPSSVTPSSRGRPTSRTTPATTEPLGRRPGKGGGP
ncbi:hypothetical protein [Streptomyces sp. NPDC059092]|uniref:hypothetical protein n=1 Tax=Streptomyces sp. NPDC059092 TaxID=3346725 RepID=UPI00368786DD